MSWAYVYVFGFITVANYICCCSLAQSNGNDINKVIIWEVHVIKYYTIFLNYSTQGVYENVYIIETYSTKERCCVDKAQNI